MNKNYKPEFTLFVYNENLKMARLLKEALSQAGYESHFYSSKDLLLQATYLTLPHIVVLPCDESTKEIIAELQLISREILIFLVGDESMRARMFELSQQGYCYDYQVSPVRHINEFKHRVNKVVDKWVVTLQAEGIEAANVFSSKIHEKSFVVTPAGELKSNVFSHMMTLKTSSDLITYLLKQISEVTGADIIYMQNSRRSESLRLINHSAGFSPRYNNLGVSYRGMSLREKESFLKDPGSAKVTKEFFEKVFAERSYIWAALENESDVFGYIVSLRKLNTEVYRTVVELTHMAGTLLDNIHKSELIYDHLPYERYTFCYSNRFFYEKCSHEISRSRRLSLSLSALTFHVSTYNESYENRVGRTIAKILKRFTRVTDVIGRLSEERFTVLFPHTSQDNSSKKAASLLKVIQAALVEQGLNGVEVRCGVSAYPQCAEDAMSLVETSEEACDQAAPYEVFVYRNDMHAKL